MPDLEWQLSAACAQVDPELFFPTSQGNTYTRDAKRVCGRCDVQTECGLYAMEHDEGFGVWGGLSERDRRRLRRAS